MTPQASDEEIKTFVENERRLVNVIRLLTNKLFDIKAERDRLKAQLERRK